ncbi:MAG: hypothetical protein OSA82_09210, partial [Paracoccaceae bacterium]|nr:hypothetical protein [Paracoccaceae bacterium]
SQITEGLGRFFVEGTGRCGACRSLIILYFEATTYGIYADSKFYSDFLTTSESINSLTLKDKGTIQLDGYLPKTAEASCPDHCPDNVQRAFIEAEKALQSGLFPSTAASYRKAVDRAVTQFVDDKRKDKMSGQKLGNLEGKSLFPEVMLDFIRVVKDTANHALHAEDHDFTSKGEVAPAREFAKMLLTYLYTLPEQVKTAKSALSDLENNEDRSKAARQT